MHFQTSNLLLRCFYLQKLGLTRRLLVHPLVYPAHQPPAAHPRFALRRHRVPKVYAVADCTMLPVEVELETLLVVFAFLLTRFVGVYVRLFVAALVVPFV